MSVYAFDLDGTLDRPELAQLANDLYDAGHQVHVVTGALADTGEWTVEARQAKLASLGVRYTSIQRALDPDINQIGRVKGRICNELGAAMIFDDVPAYLRGIGEVSSVLRLLVI